MAIAVDELIKTIQQLSVPERKYLFSTFLESNPAESTPPPIVSDENLLGGEPVISGTKTPVRAIVELWRIGTAPEEIPEHLPHLHLAQVFDALSYYASHQTEINNYIEMNRVPDELIHPAVKAKIAY